jgi:hypothetical protein
MPAIRDSDSITVVEDIIASITPGSEGLEVACYGSYANQTIIGSSVAICQVKNLLE